MYIYTATDSSRFVSFSLLVNCLFIFSCIVVMSLFSLIVVL
jgi:hypothetical protein